MGWAGLVTGVLLLLGGAPAQGAPTTATCRCDAGLERLAGEALVLLPGVEEEVALRLGWRYAGPAAEVVIVRDHARMEEEVGGAVPVWAVGVARVVDPRIVVRADLLAAGQGGGLGPVLRHEWVHLSWGSRAGASRRALPLWVEEGIAEEIGGGITVDAGAALDIAAAFDRLIPLVDLAVRFPAGAWEADLAYRQGRSWVRTLVRHAGWERVRQVLEDLVTGEGDRLRLPGEEAFAASLRHRTGLSLGEWNALWHRSLVVDARPWFHLVLRDLPWLLLVGVALAGLLAYGALRRRRRREIDRLPDGPPDEALPPADADGI